MNIGRYTTGNWNLVAIPGGVVLTGQGTATDPNNSALIAPNAGTCQGPVLKVASHTAIRNLAFDTSYCTGVFGDMVLLELGDSTPCGLSVTDFAFESNYVSAPERPVSNSEGLKLLTFLDSYQGSSNVSFKNNLINIPNQFVRIVDSYPGAYGIGSWTHSTFSGNTIIRASNVYASYTLWLGNIGATSEDITIADNTMAIGSSGGAAGGEEGIVLYNVINSSITNNVIGGPGLSGSGIWANYCGGLAGWTPESLTISGNQIQSNGVSFAVSPYGGCGPN